VLLLAAESGVFDKFELSEISSTSADLLLYISQNAESIIQDIDASGELTDDNKSELKQLFVQFVAGNGLTDAED
jgi:F0F1-type ATP synthase alpha subunit